MPRRPTARELEAAAASRPAPRPGNGPPAGEVLAMLARRGLRPRPGTPDLPWPADLSPEVESRLMDRLGHYAFRLFLRGAILAGPSFSPAEATRYLRAPRARAMAGELVAMGIAEPAGRGRYRLVHRARSFGGALEWWMARSLRERLALDVEVGVKSGAPGVGGDLDVVAAGEGKLLYLELESSPPKRLPGGGGGAARARAASALTRTRTDRILRLCYPLPAAPPGKTSMAQPAQDRNFRLGRAVRPVAYDASLSLDLDGRAFSGRIRIALHLDAPTDEVVLHAHELEVGRAACRIGDREIPAARVERIPASETVVLSFAEPLPAGAAGLDLAWTGRMSSGLRGLYMAGAGLAVTQFEAADARRVFPCFDEPGFKAPWRIQVEAPEGATVLGNAVPAEEGPAGPGRRRVVFRETPPLPTYLVALAVGGLVPSPEATMRGVPVRTWAVPEKVKLTGFGQEVAVEVLPRLEDYFDVPYAFGKLDQVGVPDFEAGAMENAGLVTYREVVLLLDPATASLAQQKRVAEVVTHELAHQWFGNWVTMTWWDDLWLNEAFATWMAYKVVDAWRPDWRVWLEFDQGKAAAMQLDALRSTHPIRAEVRNVAEAGEAFDLITYEKGGAVLRMIEGYLGEERFRAGIRLYMRRHARGNAVADDLWAALAEASREPVVELANAWIRQPGFPVVRAERVGRSLRVSQSRFLSDPAAARPDDATWPVPLVVRYADAGGVREQRHLLTGRTAEVPLPGEGEVAWVCANAGATGFYRVAYDVATAAALARALRDLAPAERIALLADEWALVRTGERDVRTFLELCSAFAADEDHAVLDELVARLAVIEHRLVSDADRPRLGALVARLFRPQLAAVGWDPTPGEPDPVRLRRASAVRALGLVARDPAAIAEAVGRLDRWLSGDRGALEPNLHDAAVALAARGGGEARFVQFQRLFESETDPTFRRRYLLALASFEDPDLSARARAMALGEAVPLQDSASFVATLLGNRVARDAFWEALRAGWDGLHARMKGAPMLLRRVVESMGQLVERRHLEEAKDFLDAHPLEEARQAMAQTLERLRQDVDLRERTQAAIGDWVAGR